MKLHHKGNYKELRKQAYPELADQLDAIWKLIEKMDKKSVPQETLDMLQLILDVKTKYPKG